MSSLLYRIQRPGVSPLYGVAVRPPHIHMLFPAADADALAAEALRLLADQGRRAALRETAATAARRYDWSTVVKELLAVYEMVADGPVRVGAEPA
jgi:glycosyltransferase involved in cell wall biosynthesis